MRVLKYQVIDKHTGRDAAASFGGCMYVVTPDGKVAWWDDSQGWEIDKEQDRYEIRVLTYRSPILSCMHKSTASI